MLYARWRLRSVLMLVAGVAVVWAGAAKWKRYAELRERIANYSRDERLLLSEYQKASRLRNPCGNQRRMAAAYLSVAAQRRREIERCEREIRGIW
jgi:hypothetical protein